MLNKEIPLERLQNLKLLILDSDGVSLPRGTSIRQQEDLHCCESNIKAFRVSNKMAEMLDELKKKIQICFSSGRTLLYLQDMYGKVLGGGTILQSENGNLSLIGGRIVQHFEYDEGYFQKIARIRHEIRKLPILGFEPKQFILTVHSEMEFPKVYNIIEENDSEQELKCMWNGEAFDIQRRDVSKGRGLEELLKVLGVKRDEAIAIGDRINDKELLETAGIGVSADIEHLKAPYWTIGEQLGGEVLVEYLLQRLT